MDKIFPCEDYLICPDRTECEVCPLSIKIKPVEKQKINKYEFINK
jgi:hypothetical protein